MTTAKEISRIAAERHIKAAKMREAGMTLKEVADAFGVNESRASYMASQGVRKLKRAVEYPELEGLDRTTRLWLKERGITTRGDARNYLLDSDEVSTISLHLSRALLRWVCQF